MRNRIAMVSQRYGLEVNGGAELLCRQLAEKLTAYYDVTVYTSCAIDYITWKNEYPQGVETINGVRVIRYPVSKQRNQEQFLFDGRAINRRQNKLRPGDAFQPFLEQRTQHLEEEHHGGTDKDPLPANVRRAADHRIGIRHLRDHRAMAHVDFPAGHGRDGAAYGIPYETFFDARNRACFHGCVHDRFTVRLAWSNFFDGADRAFA